MPLHPVSSLVGQHVRPAECGLRTSKGGVGRHRIAKQLEFVEIVSISPKEQVLEELERGDITADEAIRRLEK